MYVNPDMLLWKTASRLKCCRGAVCAWGMWKTQFCRTLQRLAKFVMKAAQERHRHKTIPEEILVPAPPALFSKVSPRFKLDCQL